MDKSTKDKVHQILDICLEKNISISFNPLGYNFSVFTETEFYLSYYAGAMLEEKSITDASILTLTDLLTKVKSL